MKKWYAIYTQSRCEKKVHQRLLEAGFESYCPLNKVNRRWSDRMKVVEEPLFKSYVFLHIKDTDRTAVRQVPGVLNFLYYLGKPAIIKDVEIDAIRRFLNEFDEIQAIKISTEKVSPGDRFQIVSGVLMDYHATALRVFRNRVELCIENIGFKLIATVEKKRLRRV